MGYGMSCWYSIFHYFWYYLVTDSTWRRRALVSDVGEGRGWRYLQMWAGKADQKCILKCPRPTILVWMSLGGVLGNQVGLGHRKDRSAGRELGCSK